MRLYGVKLMLSKFSKIDFRLNFPYCNDRCDLDECIGSEILVT